MKQADDKQPDAGSWFNVVKRVYGDDAIVVFIDLLGTRSLYEGPLPVDDQAETIFRDLISRFDRWFRKSFSVHERERTFAVSIFGDSIVICTKGENANIVKELLDFLLEYQEDLLVNGSSPNRVILTRDSFFSFKITDADPESILKSPHTSISLCGGKVIALADRWLKGLPIGIYVTQNVELDLTTQERIVPVAHTDAYPDLSFVKMKQGIETYLPVETCCLLRDKPTAGSAEIINSIKMAFQDEDTRGPQLRRLGMKWGWDVLRDPIQNEKEFDSKWVPWILAHLGKENQIVRSREPAQHRSLERVVGRRRVCCGDG